MKAMKLVFFSILAVLANMVSLFAQTVEIVGIIPLSPSADNEEPQMPTIVDEMVDEGVLVKNENNSYFVNTNLLNEYWEDNAQYPITLEDGTIIDDSSATIPSPNFIMLEDGTIIRDSSAVFPGPNFTILEDGTVVPSPFQQIKWLVGQDTDAQSVNIIDINAATQAGGPRVRMDK